MWSVFLALRAVGTGIVILLCFWKTICFNNIEADEHSYVVIKLYLKKKKLAVVKTGL